MIDTGLGVVRAGRFDRTLRALVDMVGDRYSLSEKERAVVCLTACGLHTKAVAVELKCSPKTVEEHWKRMFEKIPGRSRQLTVALVLVEAIATIDRLRRSGAEFRQIAELLIEA
jgi:DNA-binding CsgD family transcriptional regulator